MRTLVRFAGWLVFLILATGVAAYAFAFFTGLTTPPLDENTTGVLTQLRDRPVWFFMHIGGGGLALLLAPWQFASPVRNRWPHIHRFMGRLSVLAILVGGTGGLVMAFKSDAGPIAQSGFGMLAILWLTFTGIAVILAWKRNIIAHRRWMIRSAALTLAAVTLRIYIPFSMMVLYPRFGIEFETAYIAIAWACWLPNLIVAELYLRRM
jgi:hypothetical protein